MNMKVHPYYIGIYKDHKPRKYHSVSWWKRAFIETFKNFLRNTICRKWLGIEFGYTKPDELTFFIIENSEMLYRVLTHKYPEYKNLRKYMKLGVPYICREFCTAGMFFMYRKSVSCFWTNEGNIEDLKYLMNKEFPTTFVIRNSLGQLHSIVPIGYDEQFIYVNDSLGDPETKYKIVYGVNIKYTYNELLRMTGTNIKLSFLIKSVDIENIHKTKDRFISRILYSLEATDYDMGALLDHDNFCFMQYSPDGKVNINMDLGKEAKEKYILGYGQFSTQKQEKYKPEYFDIMQIIQNYKPQTVLSVNCNY